MATNKEYFKIVTDKGKSFGITNSGVRFAVSYDKDDVMIKNPSIKYAFSFNLYEELYTYEGMQELKKLYAFLEEARQDTDNIITITYYSDLQQNYITLVKDEHEFECQFMFGDGSLKDLTNRVVAYF